MDSSQRALQTNEKLISNSFSKFLPKTEKYSNEREAWILFKVKCIIYINEFDSTSSSN